MVGYNGGRIKRISLKNFMTYEDIDLYPKSGLNLIVGLNGTGKSSLMWAICLGLAGKPQYTGKSNKYFEFIKRDQETAVIEIELDNPSGCNPVITTILTKPDKCTWKINKIPAQYAEVVEAVKKFNIDMSNLCQFLPQDRVQEFSKMNKSQRLENMLQSIGEPYLFSLFNELKGLRKKFCKIEDDIKNLENKKNAEKQKNERLRSEVHKQEERGRLKVELKMLKEHLNILEYEVIRGQHSRLKRERKKIEAEKNKILEKENSVKALEIAAVTECQQLMTEINMRKKATHMKNAGISLILNHLTGLQEKVDSAKIEYRNKLAEKEKQLTKLRELKQQIEAYQMAYDSKKSEEAEIERNIQNLTNEERAISEDLLTRQPVFEKVNLEKASYKYSIDNLSAKLSEMQNKIQNERNRKLNALKNMSKDTYEAVVWLEQNRSQFKCDIFLPIFLQIIIDDENRKYIENHVRRRDLLAFICINKEDNKHFTKLVRVEKKLNINIVLAPEESLSTFKSPELTSEHKLYGLQYMLRDLFTVPDPVMSFLCCCYHVHRIPIGTNKCEDHLEKLISSFTTFFTPNVKVTAIRSRYGAKNVTIRKDQIMNRNLLVSSKSDGNEHEEQSKLQQLMNIHSGLLQKCESLSAEITNLEEARDKKRSAINEFIQQLNRIKDLSRKRAMKLWSYNDMNSRVINEKVEKMNVTEKIQTFNHQKLNYLKTLKTLVKESFALQKEIVKIRLNVVKKLQKRDAVRAELTNITSQLKDVEEMFLQLKSNEKEVKEQGDKKRMDIEKYKGQIKELYGHLPKNIPEVEQKILQIEAQLDINCEEDESVIREYRAREKEISNAEEKIEDCGKKLQELKSYMEEKKQTWLPAVEAHIQNINKKFSQYFKFLSCAGEINLDTSEDPDDFQNYGLQIRLKYREDEPFTELSQTHHSGGECSVAAIIFILSLQELTEVPFRCIDEINQGMDSVNERKVFKLISDSTKDKSCSQYFLLTPKLLTDLSYHSGVTVHVIYNSPALNTKLDIKRILKQIVTD